MAAATKKQIKLTLAYDYGDGYRTYTITRKSNEEYSYGDLKQRINAVNANMPDYFAQSFISDYYSPTVKIAEAQYIETEEEVIYGHQ